MRDRNSRVSAQSGLVQTRPALRSSGELSRDVWEEREPPSQSPTQSGPEHPNQSGRSKSGDRERRRLAKPVPPRGVGKIAAQTLRRDGLDAQGARKPKAE